MCAFTNATNEIIKLFNLVDIHLIDKIFVQFLDAIFLFISMCMFYSLL